MSRQQSWWYNTEHFWLGYPHWCVRRSFLPSRPRRAELTRALDCTARRRMDGPLKTYYLLQLCVLAVLEVAAPLEAS